MDYEVMTNKKDKSYKKIFKRIVNANTTRLFLDKYTFSCSCKTSAGNNAAREGDLIFNRNMKFEKQTNSSVND